MVFGFSQKKRDENYARHIQHALSLIEQRRVQEGAAELEKALQAKSDRSEDWCILADLYDALSCDRFKQRRFEECDQYREKAISCLGHAIRIKPDSAEAHLVLGNVWSRVDFRKALAAYQIAAQHDPKYSGLVDNMERLITGSTYRLRDLKLVLLRSVRETPAPHIADYEFYFEGGPVGCVVLYTCVSGTLRQWMHGWLFRSEDPDLFHEQPLARLTMTSTGDVQIQDVSPSDYIGVIQQISAAGLL